MAAWTARWRDRQRPPGGHGSSLGACHVRTRLVRGPLPGVRRRQLGWGYRPSPRLHGGLETDAETQRTGIVTAAVLAGVER